MRGRAILVTTATLLLGLGGLLMLPTPGSIHTVGTVGRRDDRIVRSTGAGFLGERQVNDGAMVEEGFVLCVLENIEVTAALQRKQAEIEQLRVQLHEEVTRNQLTAATIQRQLSQAQHEHEQLNRVRAGLTIQSPVAGRVTQTAGWEDIGRYVRKGDPLAKITSGPWVLNAVATEKTIANWTPSQGDRVELRLVGHGGRLFAGHVTNVAKAGSRTIDEASLTHLGGGSIPVSDDNMEAQQPFFKIQIAIDVPNDQLIRNGMTAIATFAGQRTTLGTHIYRHTLRFLNRLRTNRWAPT